MITHSLAPKPGLPPTSPEGGIRPVPQPSTARGEAGGWQGLSLRGLAIGAVACRFERLGQFVKFCLVGGSGVVVDMGLLFLLADPKCLGLNLTLSKVLAAETALANNFLWNELWSFRQRPSPVRGETVPQAGEGKCSLASLIEDRAGGRSWPRTGIIRRFLLFNALCGMGIGLAVALLHLFHTWLGWNLYLSNLLAIGLVTLWNFGMNAWFTWRRSGRASDFPARSATSASAGLVKAHPLNQGRDTHWFLRPAGWSFKESSPQCACAGVRKRGLLAGDLGWLPFGCPYEGPHAVVAGRQISAGSSGALAWSTFWPRLLALSWSREVSSIVARNNRVENGEQTKQRKG